MPAKFIVLDPEDISNKSAIANSHDNNFSDCLISRESIKDVLGYRPDMIIIDREQNPITLKFATEKEYDKMLSRLEG